MHGGGGCEGRHPLLIHLIPLLSLSVGSARNQLSPHGPNMPSPLPVLGSSCLLADFLSGNNLIWGKSGLICFTLGGSCFSCWVCGAGQRCLWAVELGMEKDWLESSPLPPDGTQFDSWQYRQHSDVTFWSKCQQQHPSSPFLEARGLIFGALCSISDGCLKIFPFMLFHKGMMYIFALNLSSDDGCQLCCSASLGAILKSPLWPLVSQMGCHSSSLRTPRLGLLPP